MVPERCTAMREFRRAVVQSLGREPWMARERDMALRAYSVQWMKNSMSVRVEVRGLVWVVLGLLTIWEKISVSYFPF